MSGKTLRDKLNGVIRDVPDFPKPGILFKDITPVLQDPALCREVVDTFAEQVGEDRVDAVLGIESRGFIFGMMLANKLNVPFVIVRKAGKLPFRTHRYEYSLEYGSAVMEMHIDAIQPGWNVLVHDDLLATGGTAAAASELIHLQGGKTAGFFFLVELGFLPGRKKLEKYSGKILSLVSF
ncbi:MAG: adenine phosphoribosyltransferase [Bacteroidia bacterium]|nr:adenine phosphoribosyltransferase [Bacteroidia bacterium]